MIHSNDFKYDLKVGQQFENELEDVLNNKKLEVKTDFRALETGNIFVEYQSRGKPSGLQTSQSDYYVFILSKDYFIFISTDVLKGVLREVYNERGYVMGGDSNTSHGVLVPVKRLIELVRPLTKELKIK